MLCGRPSDMFWLELNMLSTSTDIVAVVYEIVNSLPRQAVEFLSKVENPKSVSGNSIIESSASKCGLMIKTRLSFLRRYLLANESAPIHKSDSSIILRAKDIGAMEEFLLIQDRLGDYEPDIDDYSHSCGTVYGIQKNSIEITLLLRYVCIIKSTFELSFPNKSPFSFFMRTDSPKKLASTDHSSWKK